MNDTKQRRFAAADAPKLPTLVCVGFCFRVGEGKESKSGNYNVNPIEIQPYGGGKAITYQYLSRPEWWSVDGEGKPSFRPRDLKNVEGGKSMLFVYQKMINSKGSMSALEGLAGTPERLAQLEDALIAAEGIDGPESATILQGVFEDILIAKDGEEPVEIGYTLKQRRTKTDQQDENGKTIYVLDKGYELSEFWEPTEKNKKAYRKIAEKSAERNAAKDEPISFRVCFDEGLVAPF